MSYKDEYGNMRPGLKPAQKLDPITGKPYPPRYGKGSIGDLTSGSGKTNNNNLSAVNKPTRSSVVAGSSIKNGVESGTKGLSRNETLLDDASKNMKARRDDPYRSMGLNLSKETGDKLGTFFNTLLK